MKIPKNVTKTWKQFKQIIETSLEANLRKEPMSALLFLQLIEVDCDFFFTRT